MIFHLNLEVFPELVNSDNLRWPQQNLVFWGFILFPQAYMFKEDEQRVCVLVLRDGEGVDKNALSYARLDDCWRASLFDLVFGV